MQTKELWLWRPSWCFCGLVVCVCIYSYLPGLYAATPFIPFCSCGWPILRRMWQLARVHYLCEEQIMECNQHCLASQAMAAVSQVFLNFWKSHQLSMICCFSSCEVLVQLENNSLCYLTHHWFSIKQQKACTLDIC